MIDKPNEDHGTHSERKGSRTLGRSMANGWTLDSRILTTDT